MRARPLAQAEGQEVEGQWARGRGDALECWLWGVGHPGNLCKEGGPPPGVRRRHGCGGVGMGRCPGLGPVPAPSPWLQAATSPALSSRPFLAPKSRPPFHLALPGSPSSGVDSHLPAHPLSLTVAGPTGPMPSCWLVGKTWRRVRWAWGSCWPWRARWLRAWCTWPDCTSFIGTWPRATAWWVRGWWLRSATSA